MDYEKELKEFRKYLEYEDKEILKEFDARFPELAESEDERIRNSIIHLVKKSHEYGGYALHKDEAEKMLAWLEKQRPIWTEEDEKMFNSSIAAIHTSDYYDLEDKIEMEDFLISLKERLGGGK